MSNDWSYTDSDSMENVYLLSMYTPYIYVHSLCYLLMWSTNLQWDTATLLALKPDECCQHEMQIPVACMTYLFNAIRNPALCLPNVDNYDRKEHPKRHQQNNNHVVCS